MQDKQNTRLDRRNLRVALASSLVVVLMVGMSYAAVPLYRIFCQVTGYGGTPQVADAISPVVLEREITIRFDANTARNLGWSFKPAQGPVTLKVGESSLAFYEAHNETSRRISGTATFNVTPAQAGAYFNKIDCFCFSEQTLGPDETAQMPVSFFVDPTIVDDPELDSVDTITLSYTFFPSDEDDLAQAVGVRAEKEKNVN